MRSDNREQQYKLLRRWIRRDERSGTKDISGYNRMKREAEKAGGGEILRLYLWWYFDRMTGVESSRFFESEAGERCIALIKGEAQEDSFSAWLPGMIVVVLVVLTGVLIFLNIYTGRII